MSREESLETLKLMLRKASTKDEIADAWRRHFREHILPNFKTPDPKPDPLKEKLVENLSAPLLT